MVRTGAAALVVAALVAGLFVTGSSGHRAGAATVSPHSLGLTTSNGIVIAGVTGYPSSIPILSWSWGAAAPISPTTGLATGKVKYSEFTITKRVDATSPKLFNSLSLNQNLPGVGLNVIGGTGAAVPDRFQLKFLTCHIVSIQLSGAGDAPVESVSFNFTKVQMVYTAG